MPTHYTTKKGEARHYYYYQKKGERKKRHVFRGPTKSAGQVHKILLKIKEQDENIAADIYDHLMHLIEERNIEWSGLRPGQKTVKEPAPVPEPISDSDSDEDTESEGEA